MPSLIPAAFPRLILFFKAFQAGLKVITRLFGPERPPAFRLIVLARNRETRKLLH